MPIKNKGLSPVKTQKEYVDDKLQTSHHWWKVPKEEVYASIFAVCDSILINLSVRRRQNWFFSNLYNDVGAALSSSQIVNLYYNNAAYEGNSSNSRMTLNVIQSAVDAATAMIAKSKPKPEFITDGAKNYSTKVKAKKATKYVEGVFEEAKIYDKGKRAFNSSGVFGTGAIKLFPSDNKISAEWVYIEEILVDDLEGMHQTPQQIHQRKFMQRNEIIAAFPKYAEKIAATPAIAAGGATFSTADLIPVIESWHLPSGKKSKDGLHTICVENCTLLSEEYAKDYFPIFFLRWANQTLGFWGRGICHETWKLQLELDTLLRLAQQSMRLVGGPIIAVEAGSNIAEDHITSNRVAKIVEFSTSPPTYLIPPTLQPEIFQHIQFLKQAIFDIAGVSQAHATGQKDPTLKSAIAQREALDQATSRFEIISQAYDDLFIDMAKAIIDMSADLDNPSVLVSEKGKSKRLSFKDIKMDVDEYKIQVFPISGLPSTPEGRMDKLTEWAQAGYISREQVMDIANFPDLEEVVSLETAAYNLTQEILSNIKEYGKYMPPGPYLDLPTAFKMVNLEIDRSQLDGVDEDNIDLLRKWSNRVKSLMDEAQPPAPPQPDQSQGTPSQQGNQAAGAAMQQQSQPQQQ